LVLGRRSVAIEDGTFGSSDDDTGSRLWIGTRLEQRSGAMKANVGDRLVIKGHRVGEPDRDAEILEVHGDDGGPPFLVRWGDDGHEGLFFPGADAAVEHFPVRRDAR
jgi:hypothetical protein